MNKSENLFNLVPQPLSLKAQDAYYIFQPKLVAFCPAALQGEVAVFNEQLEASTPFKCRRAENKAEASIIIELTAGIFGSMASGVYWLTDIIGAILISSNLLLLYSFFFYV